MSITLIKILPIALKCGNDMMGDNWMFQQDGDSPHRHKKTQQWCKDNFPAFLPYDRWPANSPDLNPLDYSIWNELAQNMDWGQNSTKSTLVRELKLAVKKIQLNFFYILLIILLYAYVKFEQPKETIFIKIIIHICREINVEYFTFLQFFF